MYVYGFEKKDRANIKPDEPEAFRELATAVLGYTEGEMAKFVEQGVFVAVRRSEEKTDAEKIPE